MITNEAKRAILMAFDKLGGVDRLVRWVNADPANERIYWEKIFPRLLPRPPVEAPPAPEQLPPVRGTLIWEPPTMPPYKPLATRPRRRRWRRTQRPERRRGRPRRGSRLDEGSGRGWNWPVSRTGQNGEKA